MFIIELKANNTLIKRYTAVNQEKERYGKGIQRYKLDNGEIIKHRFEDGAEVLAKKILNKIII